MKKIVFVTSNKGKIASAQEYFKNIKLTPYEADLIEPRTDDIKEIAKERVKQAYEIVKEPCIALDSGFFINSLNGFPRAYVNHALETIGIEGILKLMEDKGDRSYEFRAYLAYYDGRKMEFFESSSPGRIADSIRGEHSHKKWSALWYIFIPEHFDKTLAEFTDEDFKLHDTLSSGNQGVCFKFCVNCQIYSVESLDILEQQLSKAAAPFFFSLMSKSVYVKERAWI